IVFLNLLGGLGLVSFSWRIFLATANAAPRTPTTPAPPTLRFGTLTLTLTVLCGAAIGAGQLALTCTTFPDCDGQWWPFVRDGAAWFALPDWHPSIADSKTLHLLHRYAALLSVLLLGHGVWMLWRSGNRRLASVVMVSLLTGTAALGIAMLLSDFPLRLASDMCSAPRLCWQLSRLSRSAERRLSFRSQQGTGRTADTAARDDRQQGKTTSIDSKRKRRATNCLSVPFDAQILCLIEDP
ncbi:MAG TPA: COX15/CtaA family protein, partial [Accumulibacter sp.]|nr:COX15/CtaA family protein [Accumulibacter sp.]